PKASSSSSTTTQPIASSSTIRAVPTSTTPKPQAPRPTQIPIAHSASGSGTPIQQPIAQQQQPPPPPPPPSPPPPTTVVPMAAQNPSLSDVSKAFLAVPELRNNGTNFELWRASRQQLVPLGTKLFSPPRILMPISMESSRQLSKGSCRIIYSCSSIHSLPAKVSWTAS
ncbi:hypothetical protein PHLCEN_2v2692, partial [Hermanssonia centrifuga]